MYVKPKHIQTQLGFTQLKPIDKGLIEKFGGEYVGYNNAQISHSELIDNFKLLKNSNSNNLFSQLDNIVILLASERSNIILPKYNIYTPVNKRELDSFNLHSGYSWRDDESGKLLTDLFEFKSNQYPSQTYLDFEFVEGIYRCLNLYFTK